MCRNINQIKICMEIGRTVILLNLENLYESLYDVLNQVGAIVDIASKHCSLCIFSYSIISSMVVIDMWILVFKHIKSSVEFMMNSSM